MKYKVIETDNFDRGSFGDKLFVDQLEFDVAERIAAKLNENLHERSPNYHVVVPQDYSLFVRES